MSDTDAKLRTDMALRMLVYGLVGRIELPLAIDSAIELLGAARSDLTDRKAA